MQPHPAQPTTWIYEEQRGLCFFAVYPSTLVWRSVGGSACCALFSNSHDNSHKESKREEAKKERIVRTASSYEAAAPSVSLLKTQTILSLLKTQTILTDASYRDTICACFQRQHRTARAYLQRVARNGHEKQQIFHWVWLCMMTQMVIMIISCCCGAHAADMDEDL